MESKVDFYSTVTAGPAATTEAEEPSQPLTSRSEESPTSVEAETVTQVIVSDTTATSSALSNLVIRQEIKSDASSSPSPANIFGIPLAPGYQLKTNSESIYVNGVLQVAGSSMDYTISGTTITFTYDIQDEDSIYATYIRE